MRPCVALGAVLCYALWNAGRSVALRAVERWAQCSAARCVALRAALEYMRCAESKFKGENLRKRFESLQHWQCYVERCTVPPLAAALGFTCGGLAAASKELVNAVVWRFQFLCTSLTSARSSLLRWQCFVERSAVRPLAAALGFSCRGLAAANKECADAAVWRCQFLCTSLTSAR